MRREDWPERLNAYIDGASAKMFDWGRHDCCTFAAGAVHAITGVDWMPEFRGRYDSEKTAKAALKDIGRGSLLKTICSKFGKPVAPAKARRGDLMLANLGDGPALMVCVGPDAIGPGLGNLIRVPVSDCRFAWSVE